MSQERQVNQALLKDLDPNSFLGKVLTTTDEEIDEVFAEKVTAATEKEIATGPIGQLTNLEKALFTQGILADAEGEKIVDDFNTSIQNESFSDLSLKEMVKRRNAAAIASNKFSKDAHRYQKIAWASVNARYPKTNSDDNYRFDKEGKVYVSQPDESNEEYPFCPGCGERHPGSDTITELIGAIFGSNRGTKKKKEDEKAEA